MGPAAINRHHKDKQDEKRRENEPRSNMSRKKKTKNATTGMMMISERASVLSVRRIRSPERPPVDEASFDPMAVNHSEREPTASGGEKPPEGTTSYRVWIEPASPSMRSQAGFKRRELRGERTIIGRRSIRQRVMADLSIDENSPYTISREHCEIAVCEGHVILTDLESHYGTQVNETPLGRACGAPESIRLSAGKHLVALGPPDCGNYFHVTVRECGFQEEGMEDMPASDLR